MVSKLKEFFGRTPLVTLTNGLIIGLLLVSGLLVACNAAPAISKSDPTEEETKPNYAGKKILFVNSYHEGYEWSDGIETGLQAALGDTEIELKFVRMDTKNNPEEAFAKNAGMKARDEIEAFQPDVIIAADDNAQKYLVVPYLKDTNVPVVFVGVNWDAAIYGFPTDHITGMIEVELPAQLVDHLKNYAKGERLGYLTVDSETERKVAQIYNERFFDGQMKEYWVNTYDEFQQQFLVAQTEVDILFLGNNAGSDRWDPEEAEAFMVENTKIPTGSINDWMAPYALITLAKSPQEQGEWSGQVSLEILGGTPVSKIPVVENKRGDLIVNLDIAEKLDVVFSPTILRNARVYGLDGARP